MAELHLRRTEAPLLEQTMAPDEHVATSPITASAPRPGSDWNPAAAVIASPSAWARSTIARPIGCSDLFSRDAAAARISRGATPLTADHVGDAQLPCRQRAGLVEGHAPHRGQLLEPGAALDQDSLARRSGKRRHDRDRRRDHQRARDRRSPAAPAIDRSTCSRSRRSSGGNDRNSRGKRRARPACRRARTDRRRSGSARAAPARARRGE